MKRRENVVGARRKRSAPAHRASTSTRVDGRAASPTPRFVLCFDGACGLCSRAVAWLLAHDRHERIWFAPLQGAFAEPFRAAAIGAGPGDRGFATVLFLETTAHGTVVHTRSRAVARSLRALGGTWGALGALMECLPRFVADAAYDAIARRRAKLGVAACDLEERAFRLLP